MIRGIYGPTYFDSSASAGLGSSWANRLAERLARIGSTESALIWRAPDIARGRSIFRLVPSIRHIGETESIGSPSVWPTPHVMDQERTDETLAKIQAKRFARAGQVSTPLYLGDTMRRLSATWSTPTVADVTGGRKARSGDRGDEMLLNGLMASWPTPQARDGFTPHTPEYVAAKKAEGHGVANLNDYMANQAPWATHLAATGPTPNGSNAPTEKRGARRGAPNPMFAMWLMGFPLDLMMSIHRVCLSLPSKVGRKRGDSPETP